MHLPDYEFLHDPEQSLVCYLFPVASTPREFTKGLRAEYIKRAELVGYSGYRTDYDEHHHLHSVYFALCPAGRSQLEPLQLMRMTPAVIDSRFPFEEGRRIGSHEPHYRLPNRQGAWDMNTYFGTKEFLYPQFRTLIAAVGLFAEREGCTRVFALGNQDHRAIWDLYNQEAKLTPSSEFTDRVVFEDYLWRNGKLDPAPVAWTILEWDGETIREFADEARRLEQEP